MIMANGIETHGDLGYLFSEIAYVTMSLSSPMENDAQIHRMEWRVPTQS